MFHFEISALHFFHNIHLCKILYFLGEQKILDGEKFIHLPGVGDDYLSATYKQWYGLKYIFEKYKSKFTIFIGTDTYVNIPKCLDLIKKYEDADVNSLVRLALKYPPATRALLGALLDELGKSRFTEPLSKSLNPITQYTLTGANKVLVGCKKWNII